MAHTSHATQVVADSRSLRMPAAVIFCAAVNAIKAADKSQSIGCIMAISLCYKRAQQRNENT